MLHAQTPVQALRAMGDTVATSAHQRRAAEFLLKTQRRDGGWGESYLSCQDKQYSHLPGARICRVCTWNRFCNAPAAQPSVS